MALDKEMRNEVNVRKVSPNNSWKIKHMQESNYEIRNLYDKRFHQKKNSNIRQ